MPIPNLFSKQETRENNHLEDSECLVENNYKLCTWLKKNPRLNYKGTF